jgi:hypothetical protein
MLGGFSHLLVKEQNISDEEINTYAIRKPNVSIITFCFEEVNRESNEWLASVY